MDERECLKWIILKATEEARNALRMFDLQDMPMMLKHEYEQAMAVKRWSEHRLNELNGIAEAQ